PLKEGWGPFYRDTHHHVSIKQSALKLGDTTHAGDFLPRDVGAGLWWELTQLKEAKVDPTKILLYLPFKARQSDREEIYGDVRGLVEKSLARKLPPRIGKAKFIAFDVDGAAYLMDDK